jgi:hypothetical protein
VVQQRKNLSDVSAGGHLEDKENAAKYEQSVNKAAAYVAQQADQPNCQQNSDECVKH